MKPKDGPAFRKAKVTHASGDEGDEYSTRVREYSELPNAITVFCFDRVAEQRGVSAAGRKPYLPGDFYQQADLVTSSSSIEGFGNAILEAIYYKRPLMVNNYSIYRFDVRPKGFRNIEIDDHVSRETVESARRVLGNAELVDEMTRHNCEIGRRVFSFEVVRQKLNVMLLNCFGS